MLLYICRLTVYNYVFFEIIHVQNLKNTWRHLNRSKEIVVLINICFDCVQLIEITKTCGVFFIMIMLFMYINFRYSLVITVLMSPFVYVVYKCRHNRIFILCDNTSLRILSVLIVIWSDYTSPIVNRHLPCEQNCGFFITQMVMKLRRFFSKSRLFFKGKRSTVEYIGGILNAH